MQLLGRKENMREWKKMWGMSVSAAPLKKIWDWIVLIETKRVLTDDLDWLKDVWALNKKLSEKQ